jgi:hypothetical protein
MKGNYARTLVGAFVNNIGIGAFYYVNAAIYSVTLILLLLIRGIPKTKVAQEKSVIKNIKDGFKYSWANKPIFGGQLIYFITNLFPIATQRTLIWVFARKVLQTDASGLGWLSTGRTLGSFIVNLIVAQLGNVKANGKIVVLSSVS